MTINIDYLVDFVAQTGPLYQIVRLVRFAMNADVGYVHVVGVALTSVDSGIELSVLGASLSTKTRIVC